jgi:monoamine oxidase
MFGSKKQSRSPFLNTLRNAFNLAKDSKRQKQPPFDELADMHQERLLHRRRFVKDMVKTGVAISAASVLNACRRAEDLVPAPPREKQVTERKGNEPKIVIIGAGMAGLNCGYQLKKAGISSSIYEASTRVGGRIFTAKDILAPGLYTELGGEFIDSDHTDMLDLCNEFGLQLLDTRTTAESKFLRDSFFINGRFYSEAEVIKAFKPYASRIEADINSLPDEISYDSYNAATLRFDNMSLSAYLNSIGMTGFIRQGIEVAYLTEYGLETDVQSSINFLYLFSPDTSDGFHIFGGSDERYKIEGGNQTLTNTLSRHLKDQINTEHELLKIKENHKGYSLNFRKQNGSTVTVDADIVVSAIPFTILRNVELEVNLPKWKTNAIRNLGYGTNAKLLLGFNERVWRNYDYSGYVFTNKAIQTGWDNSWAQPGKSGGFTVYQGGNKGLELGTGTPDSQAPQFVDELDQMWPGARKAFNGNVKRMHWPSYPYTKGSYACYKTGQYTSIRGAEIKPVGNLFFAGEHCSADYQGFMNGAAETGREAAEGILAAIKAQRVYVTS